MDVAKDVANGGRAMKIELAAYATSFGKGPFYPAIGHPNGFVYYWPNRTFKTQEQACEAAALALKDAYDAANAVAAQWNIHNTKG